VALRANDTPTAKHVSENLGQVEQVEANEGMSYGVNDMRDGVNLSRMQVTRPLVMHTEVTNLPNLMGYLRFGRSLPVVRFEDSYHKVASVAEAFEERGAPPIRLAVAVPPTPPISVAPPPAKPRAGTQKRRRPDPKAHEAELPLPPPPEETGIGWRPECRPDVAVPSERGQRTGTPSPPLELFGKPAGFPSPSARPP
jgi:hypothetical protein